jgi:hypothetical protein
MKKIKASAKPIKLRAYKVFDKDIKCRDYQFVERKLHKHEGEVIPCESGFHACVNLIDCFEYKDFSLSMRVFEVELSGVIIQEGDKHAASRIKLIRELPFYEIDEIVNKGKNNLGYGNKGNYNNGNYNKGNYNNGDGNKGNHNKGKNNLGYDNKGNYNNGDGNNGNYNNGNYNNGGGNNGSYNKGDDLDNT